MTPLSIRVGCAGWGMAGGPSGFPAGGSVLERYAQVFDAVEINSSFYRPHRRTTYERWAASTPPGFRFSVKLPRSVTHTAGLDIKGGAHDLLSAFVDEASGLGDKLGALLVQLPPKLAFEPELAASFFEGLRSLTDAAAVCEPRHASWFTPEADDTLRRFRIGRLAADPARVPEAARPAGFSQSVYYRWHGSPRMYTSRYDDAALQKLAQAVRRAPADAECWVIFDNTAAGAAADNARTLQKLLQPSPEQLSPGPSTYSI